jgi:uncharacterized RDD family membrane protein YckC
MAGMPQWQPAASVAGLVVAGAPPTYSPPQAFTPPAGPGLNYYNAAAGAPVYAGFWLRVCAAIVDWLVIGLPFFFLTRMLGVAGGLTPPVFLPGRPPSIQPGFFLLSCGLPLVQLVGYWMYYALMESSARQATLGKLALGLRVTDGAGQPISFGRATGRHFAKILSSLTLCIGYMMAGWTQRKQAMHDLIADTLVLRR